MPKETHTDFPLVTVIMSTFNGEKYLAEQIDSILGQDYPDLKLVVRDDGSTDGTLELLDGYAAAHDSIKAYKGENVGLVRSFFAGLEQIDPESEYVSFADQDDVWHQDKIRRAVRMMDEENPSIPLMYFSERNYCDEKLQNPKPSRLSKRSVRFGLSLFDNVCAGNTIVINRAMLRMLMRSNPDDIYYHDWWMELLASCFGKVIYDSAPTLEYRRLDESVSPSGKKGVALLSYRIHEYFGSDRFESIANQNQSFMKTFGAQMSQENNDLLRKFTTEGRLKKALHAGRLRQSIANELMLRGCFLLGKL